MFLNINTTSWRAEPRCAPACWVIPRSIKLSLRLFFAFPNFYEKSLCRWAEIEAFSRFWVQWKKRVMWDADEHTLNCATNMPVCVYQNWGGQNYCPPDFCGCGNVENNGIEVFFLYHVNLVEIQSDQEPQLYGRAGIWKSKSEIFEFSKATLNPMANFIPSVVFTKEKNYQW